MDNYSEWINSPETIQVEQSALILGMKVILEKLAIIPGAVPIRLSAEMLYRRPLSEYLSEFLERPLDVTREFRVRAPELAFRLEVVMRMSHSYRRICIVPLSYISYPEMLEEELRAFLLQENNPASDVLGYNR